MPDSIAQHKVAAQKPELPSADTISTQGAHVYYAPKFPFGFTDTLKGNSLNVKPLCGYSPMTVAAGNEPELYNPTPVRSSWILLLLMVSFLLVAFCYRMGGRYIGALLSNTWSVKRTKNHLDDHTSRETLTMIAMVIQTIIMEGLILYCAIGHDGSSLHLMGQIPMVALLICGVGVYYLVQLAVFRIIGFTFAKRADTELWVQGFNASQTLMGQLLAPVAVVALFLPEYNGLMLIVAFFLYIVARLVFLMKSFRIFYGNFFYCFYFILYLCGVEIIPLMVAYRICIDGV